jgi:hypothetical protein
MPALDLPLGLRTYRLRQICGPNPFSG